jgi:hypothetical protein
MFDLIDSLREAYRSLQTLSEPDKGRATTMFVMTALAYITYYIVAGTVIIVLGRRLIQASFAAFKEARRERA